LWKSPAGFRAFSAGIDNPIVEDYIHNIEYVLWRTVMDVMEQEAKIFKSLGHPARLAILCALRGGEQCVCHLESALGMRQAYISQQLTVLKEAGLVQERRDGWNMYYRVIRRDIFALIDSVSAPASRPGKGFTGPRRARRPHEECPCPKCAPGNGIDPRAIPAQAAAKTAVKAGI
jgi:DNA-binding transcriptional ArsR family regulator